MQKFILIFVLLAWQESFAQVKLASLSDALAMALSNNPEVLAAREHAMAEKCANNSRASQLLPQVKAISTFDHNFALPTQLVPAEFFGGAEGEYRKLVFGTDYVLNAGLEASMPIFSTSEWQQVKLAVLNAKIARLTVTATEFELSKAVAKTYFLAHITKNQSEINAQNLNIKDSLLAIASQKHQEGLLSQLELSRTRSARLMALEQYEQSIANHRNALSSLNFLMGIPQEEEILILENLGEPVAGVGINALPDRRYPSLQLKESRLEASLVSLRAEQLKRLPSLYGYGRYMKNAQRNNLDLFGPSANWFDIGFVGIRLELPVFTGTARHNGISAHKHRVRAAQHELEIEKQKQGLEDQELLTNYNQSLSSLSLARQAYLLGSENTSAALNNFKEGIFSLDQYLNTYYESLPSQQNYLKSLTNYYIFLATIQIKESY